MAKVITENFRVSNANDFYDSFLDNSNTILTSFTEDFTAYAVNNSISISNTQIEEVVDILGANLEVNAPDSTYYVFASSTDKENEIENTQYEKREFLRRVIFGNKIDETNLRYMLIKRDWVSGTIYDAFDDREDISTIDMYVTVLDGNLGEGPYRVYKCLDNNGGTESTSAPSGTDVEEFQLEDGYVWKYMFEVPASEYLIYQTTQSIPYVPDQDVIDNAKDGISRIAIETNTIGLFSDYLLGACVLSSAVVDENDSTKYVLRLSTEFDPRTTTDYYQGMYIYFAEGDGEIFEISESNVPGALSGLNILDVVVYTESNITSLVDGSCRVYPKVNVSKGATEDCIAYALTDSDGMLTNVNLFNRGAGYNYATASVNFPPDLTATESDVSLRTIVSPKNGHGSDAVSELAMSRVMIVTNFLSDVATSIPDNGFYTKVGLVKNPLFANNITPSDLDNRMLLTTSGIGDTQVVKAGSIVYQDVGEETVSGIIYEVDSTDIYLVDYNGAFQGTFTANTAYVKLTADSESSVEITINSVSINETGGQDGNYIAYTGELLHFIDFDPIERSADRSEKIKLIFDF